MEQAQESDAEALEALVRYGCYRRVLLLVRSCQRVAVTPDRQSAYAKVERAVLHLMDEEWPSLAAVEGASPPELLAS
jgi:hypothetical protein